MVYYAEISGYTGAVMLYLILAAVLAFTIAYI